MDGGYDCHDAIADHSIYAVIPPRKNPRSWKVIIAGPVARNEVQRASKYFGRASWRRWSGQHRRSCVRTRTHHVKLLGQRLMARAFSRQIAVLNSIPHSAAPS